MPKRANTLSIGLMMAALLAVVASGAFTAVTADRTATITTAGDDSALLGIEAHSSADSSLFGSGSTFSLSVSPGSTTTYAELINITNRGTQPVAVWIDDHDYDGSSSGGNLAGDIIGDVDDDNTQNVTFFNPTWGGNESCENSVPSLEGQGNAVELAAGETLEVGLQANTSDVSGEEADLLDEMTVHADATVNGVSSEVNADC